MAADAKKLICSYRAAQDDRSKFTGDWDEAEQFCLPHAAKAKPIYDTHGYRAARNLASGLYSNTYMPGRPWLSLVATDGADDVDEVKKWLAKLTEKVLSLIATSNFPAEYYQAMLDAGVNGNGVLFGGFADGGLFFRTYRVKEMCYSFTAQGKLDAVYREFKYTPRQAMAEFPDMPGELRVVQEYKKDPLSSEKFSFLHVVYRRPDGERKKKRKDAANLAYASVYIEMEKETVVKESGYATMPYAVLRFYRTDTDYGIGPGVASLPDLRLLSSMSADFLSALEMAICPPAFVSGQQDASISMKPGAVNYLGSSDAKVTFPPGAANLPAASAEMQTKRSEIDDEFFTSVLYQLAQMAASNSRTPMTAREIEERSDEKVLVLAPVVSRLFAEFLNAVVTRVIDIILEHRLVAAPPAAIVNFGPGLPASVKYMSRLDARINELMMRNTLNAGQAVAQLKSIEAQVPALGDLLNIDKASREIVYALNVPADIIRTEREGTDRAASRAKAQEQAAKVQAAQAMVKPIDSQKAAEPGSPLEKAAQGGGAPSGIPV